jgi:predicted 3-demethylubiquinone-9 3-methyltransferase (glyoxalase superfamily)
MQKITTSLWFDTKAQEAAAFYTSLFANSRIGDVVHYTESGPGKPGTVMTVSFTLDGQEFVAINGGPQFPFTEAISLQVNCESQEEVDRLWEALTAEGEEVQCGWLKDKYGLSWQIVPTAFTELVNAANPRQLDAVMRAMMPMKKLDLAVLRVAAESA